MYQEFGWKYFLTVFLYLSRGFIENLVEYILI